MTFNIEMIQGINILWKIFIKHCKTEFIIYKAPEHAESGQNRPTTSSDRRGSREAKREHKQSERDKDGARWSWPLRFECFRCTLGLGPIGQSASNYKFLIY